ncbi:MAG: hypothetical protein QF464_04315, partial [Myxococcota bacterium]|nr:hypothetical protein [Myxococcota bacterium]
MNTIPRISLIALAAGCLVVAACGDTFENEGTVPVVPPASPESFSGAGIAQSCEDDDSCRDGLVCTASVCVPGENKPMNAKCLLTDECDPTQTVNTAPHGLHCGWAGFCVPSCVGCVGPEDGAQGTDCATSSECQRGMFCDMQGLSGYCALPSPGAGDLGYPCEDTYGCMAGLRCSVESDTCVPGSILLFPDLFPGVACYETVEEEMEFGVRMALPGSEAHVDYFSFPFPTDARMNADGTVDMTGFPVPGPGVIGFDPIGATVDAIDGELDGWSLLPAIYFRFSHPVDETTLVANQSVRLVNLLSGQLHPIVVTSDPARNKFACGNRLFVQPLLARPLAPNTHYAAIVTTGVRAANDEAGAGDPAVQLEATPMLLSESSPEDTEDRRAWDTFAPLRGWLSLPSSPATSEIAGATVFTTGDPTAVVGEIREAVHAAAGPEVVWTTACGSDVVSRCATPDFDATIDETGVAATDGRACPSSASSNYTEYHALVRIPVIQRGERPYINDDTDALSGDVNRDAGGTVVPNGTEDVCVALSVPTGEAPDGGWPVLLYGHGTGGTHRQGVGLLGEELARPSIGKTDPKDRMVVVAWDQPMHHLRRFPASAAELQANGTMTLTDAYEVEYFNEPGPLFYNFQNPRAARGNYLQAVADTFALVDLLASDGLSFPPVEVPINGDRIAYHGHSQGGGNGPMVAPYESDIGLMILSGTGGGTVDGILGKQEPYDSSIGCRIMLQEIDVTRTHPVMHVLQHYFDTIDPAIYGPLLDAPPSGKGMHFIEVVGVDDSFTPPVSMAAYAGSGDFELLTPPAGIPPWFDEMADEQVVQISATAAKPTITDNVTVQEPQDDGSSEGKKYTRVSIQHPPCVLDADCTGGVPSNPSFDGHFVAYRNLDA